MVAGSRSLRAPTRGFVRWCNDSWNGNLRGPRILEFSYFHHYFPTTYVVERNAGNQNCRFREVHNGNRNAVVGGSLFIAL